MSAKRKDSRLTAAPVHPYNNPAAARRPPPGRTPMPPLVPPRFLVRLAHPCRYNKNVPADDADTLVDLPPAYRLDNFAALDDKTNFADVRLAWNELGLGLQVTVTGKGRPPQGDVSR